MTESLSAWLTRKAQVLDGRGLTRRLTIRERSNGQGGVAAESIDLASNDYLGLSTDSRVIDGAVAALRDWGAGATGSRLVTGTTALHDELERRLADWCQQPSALVFSSGYLANVGAITALSDTGTLILIDAHSHASLLDAARLSRADVEVFAHNDVEAVERLLQQRTQPRALIVTESVFSVLGDAARLSDLSDLAQSHDAVLVVDEAHGLGVSGHGRGSAAELGLAGADHVVVTATMSKALGSQGGVVLGSDLLRDHLVSRARTFVFDTGLAPASTGAALAALEVIMAEPERVNRLTAVAQQLAKACGQGSVAGAVLSVPAASPADAVAAGAACRDQGVRVGVFRPPSVPDGSSRLRLAARATLSDEQVDRAITVILQSLKLAA